MNKKSTAVFIGNRDCYGVDNNSIREAIIYAINSGITTFLNGGQGYFDEICATIVHKLKQEYSNIKNVLVIPYRNFKIFNKDIFDKIIYPFDELEESYLSYRAAIPERNRIIVSWSSMAISYVYRNGGASRTLDLARKNNLEIIDLLSLTLRSNNI